MSALCQKQTSRGLFDHFVGVGEQAGRNGETERPRGLELDEEIEISSAASPAGRRPAWPSTVLDYCAFVGASGRTAATPSGLMLKAKKVKGSPPEAHAGNRAA